MIDLITYRFNVANGHLRSSSISTGYLYLSFNVKIDFYRLPYGITEGIPENIQPAFNSLYMHVTNANKNYIIFKLTLSLINNRNIEINQCIVFAT